MYQKLKHTLRKEKNKLVVIARASAPYKLNKIQQITLKNKLDVLYEPLKYLIPGNFDSKQLLRKYNTKPSLCLHDKQQGLISLSMNVI